MLLFETGSKHPLQTMVNGSLWVIRRNDLHKFIERRAGAILVPIGIGTNKAAENQHKQSEF